MSVRGPDGSHTPPLPSSPKDGHGRDHDIASTAHSVIHGGHAPDVGRGRPVEGPAPSPTADTVREACEACGLGTPADAANLPAAASKAMEQVDKDPKVPSGIKKALHQAHESLKQLWSHGLAPFLAGIATAVSAMPLKISFLALNLVVLPIVALTKAFIIAAGKATGQKFTKADEITNQAIRLAMFSGAEFHPKTLKADFSFFKEIFTGLKPQQALKHFMEARMQILEALFESKDAGTKVGKDGGAVGDTPDEATDNFNDFGGNHPYGHLGGDGPHDTTWSGAHL